MEMTDYIVISPENYLDLTIINAIHQRSRPYIAFIIFIPCPCNDM